MIARTVITLYAAWWVFLAPCLGSATSAMCARHRGLE